MMTRYNWSILCSALFCAIGCSDPVAGTGERTTDAGAFEAGILVPAADAVPARPNPIKDDGVDEPESRDAAVADSAEPGCSASLEICNGTDDDCDGVIDEDAPELDGLCQVDLPGACAIGTQICAGGRLQCSATTAPEDEVCDEADNDCDGLVDENMGGEACDTGDLGVCAAGTRVCEVGAYRCIADATPDEELCNGLDDDCNGEVDDTADGVLCGCADGAPTAFVQARCGGGGYQPFDHLGACAEEAELHIVGQYTAPNNTTTVQVSRTGTPIVLVLSTYDRTDWRIDLQDGVILQEIILSGYTRSALIDAPPGVRVSNRTGPGAGAFSACGYRWPGDDQGCDTPGLVENAEEATGLTITSFQGCYTGAGFLLTDAVDAP